MATVKVDAMFFKTRIEELMEYRKQQVLNRARNIAFIDHLIYLNKLILQEVFK